MDNTHYSIVRNTQIVLSVLKAKGIRKVVASPGTTNISIVGSMMHDSFFQMYSAPDERSAAYMACGLAEESGEPVVLTCTGATASRNYYPGLTEAYYRKLPVIALTSALPLCRSGHLYPQFLDRSQQPVDLVKCSVQVGGIKDAEDEWECIAKVNRAILETTRHGGGPVHINISGGGEAFNFSVKELPPTRIMTRYESLKNAPALPNGKIAIFAGSHKPFTQTQTDAIDKFCAANDSVVFVDHTSGYHGKYRVLYSVVACQTMDDANMKPDLMIHIGEVSGDYYTTKKLHGAKEIWRVSPDGEIRDYFRKLTSVFEMEEEDFFTHYSNDCPPKSQYLTQCKEKISEVYSVMGELPFSNMWAASILSPYIPTGSTVHFGILNSLRSWNFFELPDGVRSNCNVGGFGIDGVLSSILGASLVHPEKLYFCFVGDLAFFYDMNALGNRHVGKNLRIMLVNNGKGTEFRNHTHPGSKFGDDADLYIAAGGHYGNQSPTLVKHYAEDLGFRYLSASNKEEFLKNKDIFLDTENREQPIIFELFTTNEQEDEALTAIIEAYHDTSFETKNKLKSVVKTLLGDSLTDTIKKVIR